MMMVSFMMVMLKYDADNAHVADSDGRDGDVIAGDDDENEDDDDGADGGECFGTKFK